MSSQNEPLTLFDADEYLHLARHASSVGNLHACMTYLKEALRQQPQNAIAIYFLAVQHAELGLFERAIDGMTAALRIEPRLEIARFQLGLLHLDRNRPAAAKEHFVALGGSQDRALLLYSQAMIALADGNSAAAQEQLTAGLAEASANPALSALMQRVLHGLARRAEEVATPSVARDSTVDLGAYLQASS